MTVLSSRNLVPPPLKNGPGKTLEFPSSRSRLAPKLYHISGHMLSFKSGPRYFVHPSHIFSGGEKSQIWPRTTPVLLESPWFTSGAVYVKSKTNSGSADLCCLRSWFRSGAQCVRKLSDYFAQ